MGGGHHYPFLGIWQYNIARNQKIHKLPQTIPKLSSAACFPDHFWWWFPEQKLVQSPRISRPGGDQINLNAWDWTDRRALDSKHPNFETFGSESQARCVPASGFVTAYVRRLDISLFTRHSHVLVPSPVGFLSILDIENLRQPLHYLSYVQPWSWWCICLGQVVIFWDPEEDGISTLWRFWVSFHKWGYPKIDLDNPSKNSGKSQLKSSK